MSDWALESDYSGYVGQTLGDSYISLAGFTVPLTLTLYSVNGDGSVGSTIGAPYTVDAFIPWRPAPDPADCGAGSTRWLGSDGNCYNGALSTVTFQLPAVPVPGQFIYGISYNTTNYGANPTTGVSGPYDSLNLGVTPTANGPSVGSNPVGYNYVARSGGDFGPSGYDPTWIGQIEFDSTPEPAGLALTGMGLLGLGLGLRRARSRQHSADGGRR
jgi:hypothetical protein